MRLLDDMLLPTATVRPTILPVGAPPPFETVLDRFDEQFRAVTATSCDMIRRAQEIRYQVYCVEHSFENVDDHPDGLETDEFDPHSIHSLLLHRPSGEAMGTVRLVLPLRDAPERSFAIQRLVDHPILRDGGIFPLQSVAEVSRFSISKQLRRSQSDEAYGHDTKASVFSAAAIDRKDGPLMRLGLIQALVRMSAEQGITHWCAMMEPKLLRMLATISIYFKPIGALVEHHGMRQPCYCNVVEMLGRVRLESPASWEILTDGGRLWETLLSGTAFQRNLAYRLLRRQRNISKALR